MNKVNFIAGVFPVTSGAQGLLIQCLNKLAAADCHPVHISNEVIPVKTKLVYKSGGAVQVRIVYAAGTPESYRAFSGSDYNKKDQEQSIIEIEPK
jgi:hypothetical protein